MGSAYGRTKLDERTAPDDNIDLDSGIDAHGLAPKLDDDASHFLNAQGAFVAPPSLAYDFNYWRRTGDDAWYMAAGTATLGSTDPVKDLLTAVVFPVPKMITLDRIAIRIGASSSTSFVRLGIYNNGDNMYPGSLLFDAGAVACTPVYVRSIVINQQLTPGLYWLVSLFSVAWAGSAWGVLDDGAFSILGIDLPNAPTGASFAWSVAQAYGALPDPFPAGGALLSNGAWAVSPLVRLSVA